MAVKKSRTHGALACYNAGCRCVDCKRANADYQREYKARRLLGLTEPGLRALPPVVVPDEGSSVEAAVLAEVEGLALGSERPALVAVALNLARLLDNPRAFAQAPAAAGKLTMVLDSLRKGGESGRSRLAAVRSMTGSA